MKQTHKKPGRPARAGSGQEGTATVVAPLRSGQDRTVKAAKPGLGRISALAWVLGVTFLLSVLFVGKSFFIDDTLFLRTAEQIQKHPGDFYGFQINWFHTPQPISEVTENPPLASYYVALAASILGWSEPALHFSFLLPTLAAVWGSFSLAGRYCGRPALAAIIGVFTPVFFVSATTLMCDVMLLAFWVWAVAAFEKGLENEKSAAYVGAGVLAGLAYLTKFSGLALVPLLAAYGLMRRRRMGFWMISAVIPLAVAASYEWLTYRLYGHGHFLQASVFSLHEGARLQLGGKLVVGVVFAGGCFLPALFYLPLMWKRRVIVAGAVIVVILTGVLPQTPALTQTLHDKEGVSWGTAVQAALFVVSGIHLLTLVAVESWKRREAVSFLLLLWIGGVFTFAIVINWVINARSFMPAVPAVAILVVRRLDSTWRSGTGKLGWATWLPAGASVILALLLAGADYRVAKSARAAAVDVFAKYGKPGRVIWFEGHWGFQYYMEKLGGQALDMMNPKVGPDDIVVIPNATYGASRPDPRVAVPVDDLHYLPNEFYSTMNPPAGACFYAASWGPLPFVFRSLKPDHYIVFRPVQR